MRMSGDREIGTGITIAAVLFLLFIPDSAYAYVGPGPGLTMLGALWGVLATLFLAVGAVLIWPIRALIRKLRKRQGPEIPAQEDKDTTTPDSKAGEGQ